MQIQLLGTATSHIPRGFSSLCGLSQKSPLRQHLPSPPQIKSIWGHQCGWRMEIVGFFFRCNPPPPALWHVLQSVLTDMTGGAQEPHFWRDFLLFDFRSTFVPSPKERKKFIRLFSFFKFASRLSYWLGFSVQVQAVGHECRNIGMCRSAEKRICRPWPSYFPYESSTIRKGIYST